MGYIRKLVIVRWVDSANHAIGWERKVKSRLSLITSVGFIVDETKKAITLIQSICIKGPGKGSTNNAITIPKKCIDCIQNLKQ